MKTSINVPDWLHAEVTELVPDVPFGVLVRDALLIALPTWRATSQKSAQERALRMQLREVTAKTAREDAPPAPAARKGGKAQTPATVPTRQPGAPRAGRLATGRPSVPTAKSRSGRTSKPRS